MKDKWLIIPALAIAVLSLSVGLGLGRLTAPEPVSPPVEAQDDYEEERAYAERHCDNATDRLNADEEQAFLYYMRWCYWPDWPDDAGSGGAQRCLLDAQAFDVDIERAIRICWKHAPITLTPNMLDGDLQLGPWDGLEPYWEPQHSYNDYWRVCYDDYEVSVRIVGHDAVVEIVGGRCDDEEVPDATQH